MQEFREEGASSADFFFFLIVKYCAEGYNMEWKPRQSLFFRKAADTVVRYCLRELPIDAVGR